VLQCVVVCCSVLQCIVVCCSVLYCAAVYLIDDCFDYHSRRDNVLQGGEDP